MLGKSQLLARSPMALRVDQLLARLVEAQVGSGVAPPKTSRRKALAAVQLQDFHGGSSVSVKEYQDRKKSIRACQILYDLEPHEMAIKVWLACKGEAKRA